MTDPPENNWTPHPIGCNCRWCDDPVTHQDLKDESAAVMRVMQKEWALQMDVIRDQIALLDESKTVSIMAAILYGKTSCDPEYEAKALYNRVQKTLEIDRQITGHIPAA